MSNSPLEQQVAQYSEWRQRLIQGIEAYQSWLDANGHADIQNALRIYDLVESLRQDRVTLAFVAEFSRGKTELINALFFANYKRRLLPSDVGRTTMCPTEIFYDPNEPPQIKLLPIETRKRNESIAALKRSPIDWVKLRLNLDSHEDMAQAMQELARSKVVGAQEARDLGLLEETGPETSTVMLRETDRVEIPAWRHAVINYPHPLLKNGLVILDTPGLNALGAEPELTLSMIPNAHAAVFVLAMDTGVTKSDLEVWQKYVQTFVPRRLAVLNKVDLLWDDLKGAAGISASIERQIDGTAQVLQLPRRHVFAVSAQKALLAKVRDDETLLARSGIKALERVLAEEIVPARQEILRAAVEREIGTMVESSLQTVENQLDAVRAELKELVQLSGKNRAVAKAMLTKLEADRGAYTAQVQGFKLASAGVIKQGGMLLTNLDSAFIEHILEQGREEIEGSWTTRGLMRAMQSLFEHYSAQSQKILKFSADVQKLVAGVYDRFHEGYGFALLVPPPLNLERHTVAMFALQKQVEDFCRDPVNVMTEKHFLVRRFYNGLVVQAREVFDGARTEVDAWLKSALGPLSMQIKEHEALLTRRIEGFRRVADDLSSLHGRIRDLDARKNVLRERHADLVGVKKVISSHENASAAINAA
ncbi:MAG: dynamin family protein [Betaproteobacteria bacterium]|nr:dynamin family protein [Betaproteobacteria bacterium]